MNVLVYSGPGTTAYSVKHAVESLRVMLSPHYAVSTVSEQVIMHQPWESKTAVFVIPGGADLPICKLFNGEANRRIHNFVRKGGNFIGFCSGGYYGSARCEFEVGDPTMEVSGPRELKFFPGPCRGAAVKGFVYNSEAGAKAIPIAVNESAITDAGSQVYTYLHGGGMFVDAQSYSNVEVLATYDCPLDVSDGANGVKAACVLATVGKGKALLSGPHIEFSPEIMEAHNDSPEFDELLKTLKSTNDARLKFLRSCLKKLGLKVNEHDLVRPSLTPLFLTSLKEDFTVQLLETLEANVGYYSDDIMDMGQDKFIIHKKLSDLDSLPSKDVNEDPSTALKDVFFCGTKLPPRKSTPSFDIQKYQKYLKEFYHDTDQSLDNPSLTGTTFMYSEVLTSTSVLMDSNSQFLTNLPEGFTIYGTTQVLGKGRSGNHWVSPKGVLAASNLFKLPLEMSKKAPVVFVQYICAMAYTRAILEYGNQCNLIPIKIKWPNDIYIMLPDYIGEKIDKESQEVTHAKIGGILVNTSLFDKCFSLVVGAGLNVGKDSPTTSLNNVIDAMNEKCGTEIEHFESERLLAKYLVIFNNMFERFKISGFEPFLKEYYSLWFHTDQIVTMYDQNSVKAQIVGITPDWGLLLAREINPLGKPTGNVFQLQPDGNSFDMFKGLISKKR